MPNFIVTPSFVALAIVLQWLAFSPAASAQMARPEKYFTQPIPETLRAPYADCLYRLGVKDSGTMISKSGFGHIGDSGYIGFRIEDKSACEDDRCLTIIGRVVEQRFVADTMFFAGATVSRADTAKYFLGTPVFPYIFFSPHGNVALIETSEGWAVYTAK